MKEARDSSAVPVPLSIGDGLNKCSLLWGAPRCGGAPDKCPGCPCVNPLLGFRTNEMSEQRSMFSDQWTFELVTVRPPTIYQPKRRIWLPNQRSEHQIPMCEQEYKIRLDYRPMDYPVSLKDEPPELPSNTIESPLKTEPPP